MDITGELLLITGLAVLNGALAMSEIALVSARPVRLRQRADAGDKGAKVALELSAAPGNLLSTVQVGITLIGILAGALGGANLAEEASAAVAGIPLLAPYSEAIGMGLVVALITYLSLILGELVPKQLALNAPEQISIWVSRPLRLLSTFSRPVVFVLDGSSKVLLRLLGSRPSKEPPVTIEELEHLLKLGTKHGVFNEGEHAIVARALRLGARQVGELVTPRSTMVALDVGAPLEESWAKIAASPHSYFPVYDGIPDKMIGVISVKNLWQNINAGEKAELRSLLTSPLFLPEGMSAIRALARMRQNGSPLALVIDEYGGIEGLVTLHDVLRAIVGEVDSPEQQAADLVALGEGSWQLDGLFYLPDLKKMMPLSPPEIEELDGYRTLSGFVMAKLRRIPEVGDRFRWAELDFEVTAMEGRRIGKVQLTRLPKAEAGSP
jgi:putative hemolysin